MRRAVVLLSGGLDSTTCLALALRDGFEVHALSFDYGQRQRREAERAARVAEVLGAASHRTVRMDLGAIGGSSLTDASREVPKGRDEGGIGAGALPDTYVPARNTVFLSVALGLAEAIGAEAIFLGINSLDSSGYPDCRQDFLQAFDALASVATQAGREGRGPRIVAPLLHLSKAEIVRLGVSLGLDLSITHSCYDPSEAGACGRCDACILRKKGFREAGVEDPTRYA